MVVTTIRRRALAGAGAVARYLPADQAQLFAFVASPAVRSDPWALYRRLHRRGPVRPTVQRAWLVASHAGVTQVLRHPATSVRESWATGHDRPPSGPFAELMRGTLLFTDPPDHDRLRRLVMRAFTPRRVEALRPRVTRLVHDTLARLRPAGSADLLADLALPLPVAVICDLLGIPGGERARVLRWAVHLGPRLDVDLWIDPDTVARGDRAAAELVALLHELAADPGRCDQGGLLAALVTVEGDGERLDRAEVVALAALLLTAGFETTTNLICNALLALLHWPDEFRRLRDGGIEPARAVEELLRYAGPVQFTQRVLLEDMDVGGHRIPARTLVGLLLGAANRDPRVFADPDRLELGRDPNPHVALSAGVHHCLGAALARMEAEVAIPAVLRALPELRLAARPRWRDAFVVRGLRSLPVAWCPVTRACWPA